MTIAPAAAGAPAGLASRPRPWTVLCVDDEPNILSALKRLFRGQQFHGRGCSVQTAPGGAAALELLAQAPVDLVISDMRMPEMDGAQLLEQVHQRWPETTRILLTGYADVNATIAAINRGAVSRYITKPWNDDELLIAVSQVFERRQLLEERDRLQALTQSQNEALRSLNATLESKVVERTQALSTAHDRLKRNYLVSIRVFSNLIELRGGQLVGHSRRVADLARRIAVRMGMDENEAQDVFVAALMHDIGQIGLPDALLAKPVPRMSPEELARYRQHPECGEQALLALDDMQDVIPFIRAHHERYDGQGFPSGLSGEAIPLGARILALADTFDDLTNGHITTEPLSADEAQTLIVRGRGTQFDPVVVDAFVLVQEAVAPKPASPPAMIKAADLKPGMILGKDIVSPQGVLLLAADHVLTPDLIARIRVLEKRLGHEVVLPIRTQGA